MHSNSKKGVAKIDTIGRKCRTEQHDWSRASGTEQHDWSKVRGRAARLVNRAGQSSTNGRERPEQSNTIGPKCETKQHDWSIV